MVYLFPLDSELSLVYHQFLYSLPSIPVSRYLSQRVLKKHSSSWISKLMMRLLSYQHLVTERKRESLAGFYQSSQGIDSEESPLQGICCLLFWRHISFYGINSNWDVALQQIGLRSLRFPLGTIVQDLDWQHNCSCIWTCLWPLCHCLDAGRFKFKLPCFSNFGPSTTTYTNVLIDYFVSLLMNTPDTGWSLPHLMRDICSWNFSGLWQSGSYHSCSCS